MSEAGTGRPLTFQVHGNEVVHKGFFKVERVAVSFDKPDGTSIERQDLEVAQRGDAVAALLFDQAKRRVVLVKQFRLPATRLFRRPTVGPSTKDDLVGTYETDWLPETIAGTIGAVQGANPPRNETPEECLRRRIRDEVGYDVREFELIARFFPSPGGSNELIALYFARVEDWQRTAPGGGDARRESIEPVFMDLDEFLIRHVRQEFTDVKLIVAGYWLRDYLDRKERDRKIERKIRMTVYPLKGSGAGRSIGVIAGDITEIEGVDVWVNSENTNMQMDRFYGKTVSASIRLKGAKRVRSRDDSYEVIKEDTIADALRKKLDGRHEVALKEVIATDSGELKHQGVRAIMHVAVAKGHFEQGLRTEIETLQGSVEAVLSKIEHYNRSCWPREPYRSVVFPLIGTGTGGLPSHRVVPEIVGAAIQHLSSNPKSALKTIYVNGYSSGDVVAIEQAIVEQMDRGLLERAVEPPPVALDRSAAS